MFLSRKYAYLSGMEFCPHGARLVIEPGRDVVLLDPCEFCEELLVAQPHQQIPQKDDVFRPKATAAA